MRYNSKGMTCKEFVDLMRERGIRYNADTGHFIQKNGRIKGKQSKNGYRTISLNKNHVGYTFCEHRCVWVWFNDSIPDGMEINHIDANRSNNRIENLELVNHSQNMIHAIKIGNFNAPKAEKSGKAIYTNADVMAMRTLKKNGWTTKEIAALFGARWPQVINRLIRGQRYGSVIGDLPIQQTREIVQMRGGIM